MATRPDQSEGEEGPEFPGQKAGGNAEQDNEGELAGEGKAADEPSGDEGAGDIPVFGSEQGMVAEGRGPKIAHIAAGGAGADDHQFAVKIIPDE